MLLRRLIGAQRRTGITQFLKTSVSDIGMHDIKLFQFRLEINMNIKSLLLGSAAALVAVSGARAADAIVVAEPEPAEYVRICDVYGAGYFYIPGTETCLRVGGYLRYDASFGEAGSFDGRDAIDVRNGDSQRTWGKQARFGLKTWTGQETELGTLKTFAEFRMNYGTQGTGPWRGYQNGSLDTTTNFAYMQLGGFRVGIDESAFSTFLGYAGNVTNDTLIQYGSFTTGVVQYYFDAGNGFSGVVSLEEGSGDSTIDSYVPHVIGGVKFTQGWGSIGAVVAYDSNDEKITGKIRADVKVNDQFSLFGMFGYGSFDDRDYAYTDWNKAWRGHWAAFGGATYDVNEKVQLNAQVSYESAKAWALAANVAYSPVPGFQIIPEINYKKWSNNADYNQVSDSAWGGIIRFQRDF